MKPPNRKKSTTATASCPCCKTTPQTTNFQQPPSTQQPSTACPPQPILNKGKRSSTTNLQPPKRAKTVPTRIPTHIPHQLDLSDSEEEVQQPPVRISESSSEESSTEMTYDDVIQDHVNNLIPGTHTPFTDSVSTSIFSQIKSSICKDIWRNKFVDLALLLPNSTPATANDQITINMKDMSVAQTQKPRRITSIEAWTTAFVRYTAVYTSRFPHQAPQLCKYMEIVRDIATRGSSLAFATYDIKFRTLRQTIPMPWDRIHMEFWLMACTASITAYQSPTTFRPQRFVSRPNNTARRNQFLKNTCWNFNKRSSCRAVSCPHPHVCGYCKGQHPAYDCSPNSNQEQSIRPSPIPKPAQKHAK